MAKVQWDFKLHLESEKFAMTKDIRKALADALRKMEHEGTLCSYDIEELYK